MITFCTAKSVLFSIDFEIKQLLDKRLLNEEQMKNLWRLNSRRIAFQFIKMNKSGN